MLCPQYGSAKDPVNLAGMVAANTLRGHVPLVTGRTCPERTHWSSMCGRVEEYEEGHVPGAVNIPLGRAAPPARRTAPGQGDLRPLLRGAAVLLRHPDPSPERIYGKKHLRWYLMYAVFQGLYPGDGGCLMLNAGYLILEAGLTRRTGRTRQALPLLVECGMRELCRTPCL